MFQSRREHRPKFLLLASCIMQIKACTWLCDGKSNRDHKNTIWTNQIKSCIRTLLTNSGQYIVVWPNLPIFITNSKISQNHLKPSNMAYVCVKYTHVLSMNKMWINSLSLPIHYLIYNRGIRCESNMSISPSTTLIKACTWWCDMVLHILTAKHHLDQPKSFTRYSQTLV